MYCKITLTQNKEEQKVVKKTTHPVPDTHTVTEFLKGQASKIFDEIFEQDKVVIVNKHSKPQNVIISYERYRKLKEDGADV